MLMDPDSHSQYGSESRTAKTMRIQIRNTDQLRNELHLIRDYATAWNTVVRSERKILLAAWKRVGTDLLAKYGNIATEEGNK